VLRGPEAGDYPTGDQMIPPLTQSLLQPSPRQRDNFEPGPMNRTRARATGRIDWSWKQCAVTPIAHSWALCPPKTS